MYDDPVQAFPGTLAVLAPHMDDEVLGCGATLARLPDKDRLFVIFATDGSQSPVPVFRWQGEARAGLSKIRKKEAVSALDALGIRQQNVIFLDLPDGRLGQNMPRLITALKERLEEIRPDHILAPFRYDKHPDHLALHAAVLQAADGLEASLYEYFVYNRWRMLPGGDIRSYIRPDLLIRIDSSPVADVKLHALERYVSQTTLMEDWQDRPILPRDRLTAVSASPELFMTNDPGSDRRSVFQRWGFIIPLIHRIEPFLKTTKEQFLALGRLRRT